MINNKIIPVINEKSILCIELESEQYTFDVCAKLSKPEIKQLMENTFQLKVDKLTTQTQPRLRRSARLGGSLGSHLKRVHVSFKKPAPLITQYWAFRYD